jgi:hypothetical protein
MNIAAVSGDLEALKGMEEEEVYSELSDIRNNNNNTPLEVLYEYLEDIRSGRLTSHPNLCQSDEFQGSEDRHVHSFAFLEELETLEGLARLKGDADCRQYFNIGGSVYKVADAVFKEVVKNDDMVGDRERRRASGDERAKLPKCRNDREFRSSMIRCRFECSF